MRSTFSASARTRGLPRRPSRRLTGAAAVCGFLLITAAAAGCSGSAASSSAPASGTVAAPAASAAAVPSAAGAAHNGFGAGTSGSASSSSSTTDKLVATGQQLIYTAQLSVRAKDVQAAVNRATSVVSAAGGYVSTENIVAAPPGHPNEASASVTLKIPAAAYTSTLAALSGSSLGTQLSLTQQTQDVTQQVADVQSRVLSDQAAIAQLRDLLKHAGSVSSLLEVQNQINSEESDLESMLAQQNALNHETAFATVTLSLIGPKAAPVKHHTVVAKPPPGLTGGLAGGWHAFRLTISWLLTVVGAVAPFVAVIVVVGGLGWWSRRRLQQRRQPPPASPDAA